MSPEFSQNNRNYDPSGFRLSSMNPSVMKIGNSCKRNSEVVGTIPSNSMVNKSMDMENEHFDQTSI
jgi:hypothetical protein